jgi:hypothetical protein
MFKCIIVLAYQTICTHFTKEKLYKFSAHCGPAVPLTFENGRKGVFGVFIWFMIVPKQNKDLRVTVSVAVNSVWLQAIKSFQLEITV